MAIERRTGDEAMATRAKRPAARLKAGAASARLTYLGGAAAVVAAAVLGQAACSDDEGAKGLFAASSADAVGSTSASTSGGVGGAGGMGTTSSSAGQGGGSSSSTGGPPPGPVPVCINEVMADNQGSLVDELGNTPPWIEIHNPTKNPVNISGWTLSDDVNNPQKSVIPQGFTVDPGGFLVFYADGDSSLGPKHLDFTLMMSGGVVTLYAPGGGQADLTFGASKPNVAVARVPDCCTDPGCLADDLLGSPGKTNVEIPTQTVEVLAPGSTYRYYDFGIAPVGDWTAPGFNDVTWASGKAPLGYGDAHIVTTVSYGINANNKYITTWVRTTFDVQKVASVLSATLEILRDDGAVAYVNGQEVARTNMPAGAIGANTAATASVGNAEETTFFPFALDPALLVEGTNTLAIEVHQQSAGSSDLGIDARVTVETPVP